MLISDSGSKTLITIIPDKSKCFHYLLSWKPRIAIKLEAQVCCLMPFLMANNLGATSGQTMKINRLRICFFLTWSWSQLSRRIYYSAGQLKAFAKISTWVVVVVVVWMCSTDWILFFIEQVNVVGKLERNSLRARNSILACFVYGNRHLLPVSLSRPDSVQVVAL